VNGDSLSGLLEARMTFSLEFATEVQKMSHSVSGSSRNICSCANTTCLQKHRLSRDQLRLADLGANVGFRYWGYTGRYAILFEDRF
jgi:hypothetical protein